MIAAFASLAFIVVIGLCALIAAATLEASGSKIMAALKGRSPLAANRTIRPIKIRVSQRYPTPEHSFAPPTKLRAAA